jgi:hypothetical protein
LCPRGLVADFLAAALDFVVPGLEVLDFFVVPAADFLPLADEPFPEVLPAFAFVVDLAWVVAEPEVFCEASSLCLAGAGVTAKTAARSGARTRNSAVAEGEKGPECIIPL